MVEFKHGVDDFNEYFLVHEASPQGVVCGFRVVRVDDENVVDKSGACFPILTHCPFMPVSQIFGRINKLPAESIRNHIELSRSVMNVYDVVSQDAIPPPGVGGVEGRTEEVVTQSLEICFQFH